MSTAHWRGRVTALLAAVALLVAGAHAVAPVEADTPAPSVGSATAAGIPPPAGPVAPPTGAATIGVVSMNELMDLSLDEARADFARMTARPDVDVVAIQEAHAWGPALEELHGWDHTLLPVPYGGLAIAWRTSTFTALEHSVRVILMHPSISAAESIRPQPPRYTQQVTLRHRGTGRAVTVVNTHVNSWIEQLDEPGMARAGVNATRARRHLAAMAQRWGDLPGDVALAVGDFNVDHSADEATRSPGMPAAAFAGRAVNSYTARGGVHGLLPTHVGTGRWIDYVWMDVADYRVYADFTSTEVLTGYHSDHRPLLVTVALGRRGPLTPVQTGR